MPYEAERMDAPPLTRIVVEGPDGTSREVLLTPDQARAAAWQLAKAGGWIIAGIFGLGWALGRWTAD